MGFGVGECGSVGVRELGGQRSSGRKSWEEVAMELGVGTWRRRGEREGTSKTSWQRRELVRCVGAGVVCVGVGVWDGAGLVSCS